MDAVHAQFKDYMKEKSHAKGPRIAYFSMEYGLHSSLKIYSGGLGILAGDYLKEASDKNVPMVAVGLLYRYGYFTQKLSRNCRSVRSATHRATGRAYRSPSRAGSSRRASGAATWDARSSTCSIRTTT